MWKKKPIHWEDEKHHYISFVFSWDLWEWCQSAQPDLSGKQIVIGGPAVILNPEWVPGWVKIQNKTCYNILQKYNQNATRTTYGCIRKCDFCAVPLIDGHFRELECFIPGNVLIDNNLLACSKIHFQRVVDHLKCYKWCDFSQGLDCRLMTKWHAEKLSELQKPMIRLAWDNTSYEKQFFQACELLKKAGIPKRKITCYVLIGFNDDPEDALYRLQSIYDRGYSVFPMRYQPLNSKKKNGFVGKKWTDYELNRYMRYWGSRRFFAGIPFADFDYNEYRRRKRRDRRPK